MFDLIKLRWFHNRPVIRDLRNATPPAEFVGYPELRSDRCGGCDVCAETCPTRAIAANPLRLDLGRCTFCRDCVRTCPAGAITFTNRHRLGATSREALVVASGLTADAYEASAIAARREIHRLFGRSLKLRQVSAAGCNGCEMELAAAGNVNFDMGRFGIDFVASPRHADGVVITGPVSRNMAPALRDTYLAVPQPRIVIAAGACAISGGIFADSPELDRSFFDKTPVDLYVPGCPPHPLAFIHAVLQFIGRMDYNPFPERSLKSRV